MLSSPWLSRWWIRHPREVEGPEGPNQQRGSDNAGREWRCQHRWRRASACGKLIEDCPVIDRRADQQRRLHSGWDQCRQRADHARPQNQGIIGKRQRRHLKRGVATQRSDRGVRISRLPDQDEIAPVCCFGIGQHDPASLILLARDINAVAGTIEFRDRQARIQIDAERRIHALPGGVADAWLAAAKSR
jgi:hypothetical protein